MQSYQSVAMHRNSHETDVAKLQISNGYANTKHWKSEGDASLKNCRKTAAGGKTKWKTIGKLQNNQNISQP